MRPAHGPSKTNCSITPKWQSMITHCKECKWLPMEWLEKPRVMVVHGWKIDVWFSVITPLGGSLLIHQTTASVFTAVPSKYNWMETRGAVCFLYFPFSFFLFFKLECSKNATFAYTFGIAYISGWSPFKIAINKCKKKFQSNKMNSKSSSASSYTEDLHVSGQIWPSLFLPNVRAVQLERKALEGQKRTICPFRNLSNSPFPSPDTHNDNNF